MRATVVTAIVLCVMAGAGCAPRIADPRLASAMAAGGSSSSCSPSRAMAVPYFAVAAAGVAATGALWPQVEQLGDAARNGCEGCDYSMMLYAAPAVASAVAVGLGVSHLERAEACEEHQRLLATSAGVSER